MTASPSPVSATPWLTLSIRLMAGGFLLFFGLALATLLLRLDQSLLDSDAGRLLLRLVRWGDQQGGGQHYELMISTIYLVWAHSSGAPPASPSATGCLSTSPWRPMPRTSA
ncbi:hypothetical protein Q031_05745 [Pseudomonas aeruginosa BWHPSA018]|nr:hypothetical protein Q031_05745 [Pseudomonas aeruginosa BWHPSA018]